MNFLLTIFIPVAPLKQTHLSAFQRKIRFLRQLGIRYYNQYHIDTELEASYPYIPSRVIHLNAPPPRRLTKFIQCMAKKTRQLQICGSKVSFDPCSIIFKACNLLFQINCRYELLLILVIGCCYCC